MKNLHILLILIVLVFLTLSGCAYAQDFTNVSDTPASQANPVVMDDTSSLRDQNVVTAAPHRSISSTVPTVDETLNATRRIRGVDFSKFTTRQESRAIAEQVVREHRFTHYYIGHRRVALRHHRRHAPPAMAVVIKEKKVPVGIKEAYTESSMLPGSILGAGTILILFAMLFIFLLKKTGKSNEVPASDHRPRAEVLIHPDRRDLNAGRYAYKANQLRE